MSRASRCAKRMKTRSSTALHGRPTNLLTFEARQRKIGAQRQLQAPLPTMAVRLARLEKIYRRNPQSILFAHLADLYLHKGQVSRALLLCEAGCKLFPNYASGFAILSKCHHARGDLENACRAQRMALDLDPENPRGLVRLAQIYHDLDRPAPALESLQQAAGLDDLDLESKELMDRLTYAMRLESTDALATAPLDSETQLDALALEAEGKEQESEAEQISGRRPAAESSPPAANSPEDGKTPSSDRLGGRGGTAPGSQAHNPGAAEELAADSADPEGETEDPGAAEELTADSADPEGETEDPGAAGNLAAGTSEPADSADPAAEDGQSPEQNEAGVAVSPPRDDDELVHLFEEIENQEGRESPAEKTSLPVAPPAANDAHQIATATLAQIYSDQGLVQRAVDTYRQMLEKDPDNKEIQRRLAELE